MLDQRQVVVNSTENKKFQMTLVSVGRRLEQPVLVEGVPAHCKGLD